MILLVHHIWGKQMNISKWNKRMVPYSITIYFVSSFYPFKFSLLRDIHEQSSDCVQPYFTTFFCSTNININLIFTLIIKLISLVGLVWWCLTPLSTICQLYPLSSKSSGRNCSVIFRYKSIRHVWHTGDDKM